MNKMREEFEAWCDEQGFASDKYGADDCGDAYKHLVGEYVIGDTMIMWDAWQASRAALRSNFAAEHGKYRNEMDAVFDDVEVIDKAGVSYKQQK